MPFLCFPFDYIINFIYKTTFWNSFHSKNVYSAFCCLQLLAKNVTASCLNASSNDTSFLSEELETDDGDNAEGSAIGEGKAIPFPYVLCRFPGDIQRLLDSGEPALATDSLYRRKIRKTLAKDMTKYTLRVFSFRQHF